MGELLQRMAEGSNPPSVAGFLTTGNHVDMELMMKQWSYYDRLALHMYQVSGVLLSHLQRTQEDTCNDGVADITFVTQALCHPI